MATGNELVTFDMVKYMKGKSGTIDFGWESGTLNLNDDGSEAENNNYVRSSFIPTKALPKWKLVINGVLATENRINTVWYTGAKTYYGRGPSFTETTDGITAPYDAKFIRFVIKKEVADLVKLVPNTEERLESAEERLEGVESVISDVRQGVEDVERELDAICDGYKNLDFGWEYGKMDANGDEAPATGTMRSAFLPADLLRGMTLNIDSEEPLSSGDRVNDWFYDENKTFIGRGNMYTATAKISIPPEAVYVRFTAAAATPDKVSAVVLTRQYDVVLNNQIADVRQGMEDVERELESVRLALPDHSALSLNRDKEHLLYDAWQARDQQLQRKSVDDPNGSALGFLHFSDVHGNLVSWKRLGAYLDHFGDMFSFAIHTGDYVPSSQSDYNSDSGNMYQRVTTVKPIFNCVGNHDVIASNNQNADISSTRNILFSDIANWGVTRPSDDAMYYYRDFGDVRLIVLDQYYANDAESEYYANDAESAWLEGVLNDALSSGKSVITASHTQTAPITHNISTFNNIDRPSSALPATNGFENKIKAFKDSGGTHICHLGGHWHWDVVGTTDNGILNIIVECATFYGGGYRNDIRRYGDKSKVNSRAYDCFNAVFVDTQTKTLRIIRIGSNSDNYLHSKNTLCIKYDNNTLVSNA